MGNSADKPKKRKEGLFIPSPGDKAGMNNKLYFV